MEYAILIAGIAAVIGLAIVLFGVNVLHLFETVCQPFTADGC